MDKALRAALSVVRRRAARIGASTSMGAPSFATQQRAGDANPISRWGSAPGQRVRGFLGWGWAGLDASASHAGGGSFASRGCEAAIWVPGTRGIASSSKAARDERFTPVEETPEMEAEYRALAQEIRKAPKKQQRHMLSEALKGTRLRSMRNKSEFDKKEQDRDKARQLQARVIDINRTTKVTKGGGLQSFTALVVVGNGDGIIGYSTGKGKEVIQAVEKAYSKAIRSLVHVERFEKHTIYHEVKAKHCKTKIHMIPKKKGSGMRCNQIVETICELAGITSITAKVHGSHHPHNTVRATFEALEAVESAADLARRRNALVYQI